MKYWIIIFSLLFCSAISAQQKWTVISTFPRNPIPYFFNETYGFVISWYNDQPALYRTVNGGKNWNIINVVAVLDQSPTSINLNNLYFDSPNHLYGSDADNLYESIDSGLTWKAITVGYGGNSFYIHDGTIYSASGTHSTDDGKTWIKDLSSLFAGGYSVIGNKENGIACFSGGIQNLDNGTLFTTDGGLSWAIGEHKDFGSGYAIPYTLTYFRVCPDLRVAPPYPKNGTILDSNIILRSTNGGATWQNIFPNTAPPCSLGATFAGSGSVIFAQLTSKYTTIFDSIGGVIRSVNFGKSWDTIGGPRNPENTNPGMSAVSRGAICFAGDYFGKLWKFIDSSLLRNATWDLTVEHSSNSISHDTLFAGTCDSARLTIHYGFNAADYVKLDDINVDGISPSEYRADFIKDKVIMAGRADTCGITFIPSLPGTYPINIHTSILRDDWVREDTVFSLILVVKPNPPVLSLISNRNIDFGAQTLCIAKTVTDSFSMSNAGCDSLQIQSIAMEVDQNPKSDFSLAPVHSFAMFRADPAKKFFISYKPSAVGAATGRVIITTNAGIDTINLKGEGLRDRHTISFDPDTLRAKVGDTVIGYLPISNLGCRLMDLDSVQTQTPLIFPPSQFYFPLGSSEIEDLKVLFSPLKIGLSTVSFHAYLRVLSETDTISYDTTFSVTIDGLSGSQSGVLTESPVSSDRAIVINSLHPDPAQDEIEVDLQSIDQESAGIEILNTLGTTVYSDRRDIISGSNKIHLMIHNLSEGAYIVRIHTSKGEVSQAFTRIR